VLLVAVLHFISDDDNPLAIVAAIIDALPPDSYLVLSHVASDIRRESAASAAVHYKKVSSGATLRGREEILRFFAGLELIEPGVVQVPYWHTDGPEPADAGKVWILGVSAVSSGRPRLGAHEQLIGDAACRLHRADRHGSRVNHWRSRVHWLAPGC